MRTVTVLGTGIMGAPIVRNLALAGLHVNAWNRTAEKAAALVSSGVRVFSDPREAVSDADLVIVMLSTGVVIEEVLFGASGASDTVASRLPAGIPVVVMSSIPVSVARDHAQRLHALGHAYVDAPVSGGQRGAIGGTLTIMAGGEAATIARVQEYLRPLGRLTHVGPCGSGQLAKLANQVIVGITIAAVAEALLLVEAGGADPHRVCEALIGGFADSTILRQHGERMVNGNFVPGAYAHLQLKDMRTALALAADLGVEIPTSALVGTLYEDMCGNGLEGLDHSGLFVELKRRSRI
ncbi:MAG: NAD(P)-dependent oxidoreductase [Pseudomonadota bacterium]